MAPTSRDPYTILGVTKDATPADIAAAYRRLALRHHPDRGGDAKMFILIGEARALLLDPTTRRHFDASGWYNDFRSDGGSTGAPRSTAGSMSDSRSKFSRTQSPPPQPREWSDDTWDSPTGQANARRAKEEAERERRVR